MNTISTIRVGEQTFRLSFTPDLSSQLEDESGEVLLSFVRKTRDGCVMIVVADITGTIGHMVSERTSWVYHNSASLQHFNTLRPRLKDAVFLVSRHLIESF